MSKRNSSEPPRRELSRRRLLTAAASAGGVAMTAAAVPARAAITKPDFQGLPPYGNGTLPDRVRSRLKPDINGLTVNILEAGFEMPDRPLVLLLHGFPNLAYSWRKVMPALANAGYYAVAPDCLPRIRPHNRLGRLLGRRSRSVSRPKSAARPDCARLRARLS
jgi:hypothetical protein